MANENKFPSEVIDLPSKGKLYSKDSSLASGKLEIKYMTAREEDILTSQNLIKKGVVIDRLLDSLIMTEGVNSGDLIVGDKNAVMVAARILAYGPEYNVEVTLPNSGEKVTRNFNLADCPFKKLPNDVDYSNNEFEITLPASKTKITFKLLNGVDELNIAKEIKASQKLGTSTEMTTRFRYLITSVNGKKDQSVISNFASDILSRDSLFLRQEINRISPDIELLQEIDVGGEMVEVDIPLTIDFFWPKTTS